MALYKVRDNWLCTGIRKSQNWFQFFFVVNKPLRKKILAFYLQI